MLQHTFFKKLLPLSLSLILIPLSLTGQGTQEQFGQNRVQYKEFAWQYYQSANFITYFNQGGQSLGRFASQMAEMDLKEIEEMLDYKINRKVELMVYNLSLIHI